MSIRNSRLPLRDLIIFSLIGAIMFVSRLLMQLLPNIHILALVIASITMVYRKRALIPIYIYVALCLFYYGISVYSIPNLYIWLPLWGVYMVIGKFSLPKKIQAPLYMIINALHGLSFGSLYAIAYALILNLNFSQTLVWIYFGLPYDILHAIGNFAAATLVIPLTTLIEKCEITVNKV